ncbi:MAG: plasmid stabilization protein ParE [Verrucomicrobia bacterium]|nr:MAG: plasmid stabilization protein ParE [Verrucomicrobiota bacterium]
MARFQIRINEDAVAEIKALPAPTRKQVIRAIESQLVFQPNVPTRNRKLLRGLIPPWDHVEPTWEIRVGEYRVFYDIDEKGRLVHIRAVRHKPPHTTTEQIL